MNLIFERDLVNPARQFLERIGDGLVATHNRQKRYFAIGRTRRKLLELPDHVLHDIGISRGEIDGLSARVHQRPHSGGNRAWRLVR